MVINYKGFEICIVMKNDILVYQNNDLVDGFSSVTDAKKWIKSISK